MPSGREESYEGGCAWEVPRPGGTGFASAAANRRPESCSSTDDVPRIASSIQPAVVLLQPSGRGLSLSNQFRRHYVPSPWLLPLSRPSASGVIVSQEVVASRLTLGNKRRLPTAALSTLPDPHELRSCGASDGELPTLSSQHFPPPTSSARAVHQMVSYREFARCLPARLSVMLSHIHAPLRAEADTAPLEIAFCYQNNLAHLLRLGARGSTSARSASTRCRRRGIVCRRRSSPSGSPHERSSWGSGKKGASRAV